jgi:hypothetical protein
VAGDPPRLPLQVSNPGGAPVTVTPEVTAERRTITGVPGEVGPGATREWSLALPAPARRGTFPALVRVHGADADALLVATVPSPAAVPSPVRATFAVPDVAGATTAVLHLENPGPTPVAGRVFYVLPDGLRAAPESQPAVLPAGGRVQQPLVVETAGAPVPAEHALFAVLEYDQDGQHHAVVATTTARVLGTGRPDRALPLTIGVSMLVLAVVVLGVAWRSARRRAA